jgi:ATP-dependent Clp protease ATP-binding subunit ClpA
MFERFTAEARRSVTRGAEVAAELRHNYVGTEHLLIAVCESEPNAATEALFAFGFDPVRVRSELERMLGPCPGADLGDDDAAALRTIGVDLDAIKRRAEASFGPGALDRDRRWHGRRRGRVCGAPFTTKAKRSLELALREAVRLGHHWIGGEHVLLGLLRPDTMSARIVAAQGVDIAALRREIVRTLRLPSERGA